MITLNDIIVTLIVFLCFVMIFLLMIKIHIANNKSLLNEIEKVTSTCEINEKYTNYKEFNQDEFNKLIFELKNANIIPTYFIEIECGNCKNMAYAVAKGILKAKGFETNKKNYKNGLKILEKLPESINKNINIENKNIDEIDIEAIPDNSLVLIHNKNYSDELNKKVINLSKKNVYILEKVPEDLNLIKMKNLNNYTIVKAF